MINIPGANNFPLIFESNPKNIGTLKLIIASKSKNECNEKMIEKSKKEINDYLNQFIKN